MTPQIAARKQFPFAGSVFAPVKPRIMTACLILTDTIALVLAVALGLLPKLLFHGSLDVDAYLRLWPFLFVFLVVYGALGLYSEASLSPPDELKRTTISSAIIFVVLASATETFRGGNRQVTASLILTIFFSVMLLPILRTMLRQIYSKRSWWGHPAVIFGSGPLGQSVTRALLAEPETGLKPSAIVGDTSELTDVDGVPVLSGSELAYRLLDSNRFAYGIVTIPGQEGHDTVAEFERNGFHFSHVIYLPESFEFSGLWVRSRSVAGRYGVEVQRGFLVQEEQLAKRALDLSMTLLCGFLILPITLAIALAIRIDSPGPVLFRQRRIGRGGLDFFAWKFRTMVTDADRALERHLANNPELRAEWERDHKLKNDPRVTRVGRFLRKTSLDELPQIWNVIKGEMSLVGPRPIVQAEIDKYGAGYDFYTKVPSGVTGLWQVSGRNDTSYQERIRLDCFYVSNWSVWLDLCILFRTIGTVLLRKGAY